MIKSRVAQSQQLQDIQDLIQNMQLIFASSAIVCKQATFSKKNPKMSTCPLIFHEDQLLTQHASPLSCGTRQAPGNFLKSLQFSPDGAYTLSATEDNFALISTVDQNATRKHAYYSSGADIGENVDIGRTDDCPVSMIPIGEAIYDLKWYPHNQGTNCFVSTSRDHPIVLWDAGTATEDASMRCTYRGYDQADELESAISVCFNLAGDKLYAGSNRMIRCFDVARPGRECSTIVTTPTKKSPYGQKGLISTISFNPDYSGAYAAGSYAHSVGVYVENTPECALLLAGLDFGVTCVKWSPCGRYLWVGGRNNSALQCWDIRATQSIVGSAQRKHTTNQRMAFDLDPWGKYLCTGDQDGQILFYDTTTFALVNKLDSAQGPTSGEALAVVRSCVNSVQFHPFSALLGVATGERRFTVDVGVSDSDFESDNEGANIIVLASVASGASSTAVNVDSPPEETARKRRKLQETSPAPTEATLTNPDTEANELKLLSSGSVDPDVKVGNSCVQIWRLNYTPIALQVQSEQEQEPQQLGETVCMDVAMELCAPTAALETVEDCEQ